MNERAPEEMERIANEIYGILKREAVTLEEMEHILADAGRAARTQPIFQELYDRYWRKTPINKTELAGQKE